MMGRRTRSAVLLACVTVCLALTGCGKNDGGEGAENTANASSASVVASESAANSSGSESSKPPESAPPETESPEASGKESEPAIAATDASTGSGEPECGVELLKELPAEIPIPANAKIGYACKDENEYGTGIAVSYQAEGDAEELVQLYRDALEGDYEVSQFDVPGFVSMQFVKGEEAVTLQFDASGGSPLHVMLAYGTYEGGFDQALEEVLGEIVETGE